MAGTRPLIPMWYGGAVPAATLRSHQRPPPCVVYARQCVCNTASAASFFDQHDVTRPPLTRQSAAKLRIFFLDGHVGPMNDMLATLHEVIGIDPDGVEGMVMMQGMLVRHAIDKRFFKCRLCLMGVNTSRVLAAWLLGSKSSGRSFTLPGCEKHRCREAVHNEHTRREFARVWGPLFERTYDAVACNFPSWQCSLFMYVNVAVIMRFTHRCARRQPCSSACASYAIVHVCNGACAPRADTTTTCRERSSARIIAAQAASFMLTPPPSPRRRHMCYARWPSAPTCALPPSQVAPRPLIDLATGPRACACAATSAPPRTTPASSGFAVPLMPGPCPTHACRCPSHA